MSLQNFLLSTPATSSGSENRRPLSSTTALSAGAIFKVTLCIIGVLVIANLGANASRLAFPFRGTHALMHWFDLDGEQSIPSFFSSIQLVLAAGVTALAARAARPAWERRGWTILACGMVYMAVDEAVGIHEAGNQIELVNADAHPAFGYGWVIPGMAVILVAGLVLLPFVLRLPRAVAVNLVLSGSVFVGGAIGMEMVGANVAALSGKASWAYVACYTVEETMEMVGIALYIRQVVLHGGPFGFSLR